MFVTVPLSCGQKCCFFHGYCGWCSLPCLLSAQCVLALLFASFFFFFPPKPPYSSTYCVCNLDNSGYRAPCFCTS